jgi:hypothetical protein
MPNQEDKYVQVTITPLHGPNDVVRYRLMTDVADNEDQPWVKTGTYNTLQDLFAAFDWPLCTEYRVRIVRAFRDGAGDVKFSLKDAFETV